MNPDELSFLNHHDVRGNPGTVHTESTHQCTSATDTANTVDAHTSAYSMHHVQMTKVLCYL